MVYHKFKEELPCQEQLLVGGGGETVMVYLEITKMNFGYKKGLWFKVQAVSSFSWDGFDPEVCFYVGC